MKKRKQTQTTLIVLAIILFVSTICYTLIGTSGNIDELKRRVPVEIGQRNWKILRYEGFEYGSWNRHGGKVWYHVCNIDNPSIQYRVNVSIWGGELQYYYGEPEVLNRLEVKY